MFLSKKGKAFHGNEREKTENIENMTKILFEEVSNLNRRFKILEHQVKTIIQEVYGIRKIGTEDSDKKIISTQQSPSEIVNKSENSKSSIIAEDLLSHAPVSSPTSSNDFFSPPLSLKSEKDITSPASHRFTASPSESTHPPKIPTFPSPSPDEEKESELAQKDTIYHIIPRVKLATKSRSNKSAKTEE